jgi:farnesyl diphosphate synthase
VELQLREFANATEASLATLLQGDGPPELSRAEHYALFGSAKRFRPFLVAACFDLLALPAEQARTVGAAAEMAHAASLVFDDLPCMDASEVRRAAPSLYRATDEATAVLAGLSLVLRAVHLLSSPAAGIDAERRSQLTLRFAESCGAAGLAGGQFLDLAGAVTANAQKTAPLMGFCCEAAAICAGQRPEVLAHFREFGEALGRLYQHRDDELDDDGTGEPSAKQVEYERTLHLLATLPPPVTGSKLGALLPAMVDWVAGRAA